MAVTTSNRPTSAPQGSGIPCPKCHEPTGALLRPAVGVLEFKCGGCGHQWLLFDRAPQDESER